MQIPFEQIHKGQVLIYRDGDGNEALVRVHNIRIDNEKKCFLVNLVQVRKGLFPKRVFQVVITDYNCLGQGFYTIEDE